MKARAQQLNGGIVRVEHYVDKLKTPEGAKGYAYQYGQAGFAAMYGVGARTLGFARDKINPVQQGAEMGWTLVFSKEKGVWEKISSSTVDKQVKDFKEYGSEMANTTTTSYEIASGQLHTLYLATRPSYNTFQSALKTFYGESGTSAWNRASGMMQELEVLGVLHGAVAQMETSAAEYANIVQTLGIMEKAENISKMSKGIEGGMVNSVEVAVDLLAALGHRRHHVRQGRRKGGARRGDPRQGRHRAAARGRQGRRQGSREAVGLRAAERIRTADPVITSDVLYQLSYGGVATESVATIHASTSANTRSCSGSCWSSWKTPS